MWQEKGVAKFGSKKVILDDWSDKKMREGEGISG